MLLEVSTGFKNTGWITKPQELSRHPQESREGRKLLSKTHPSYGSKLRTDFSQVDVMGVNAMVT